MAFAPDGHRIVLPFSSLPMQTSYKVSAASLPQAALFGRGRKVFTPKAQPQQTHKSALEEAAIQRGFPASIMGFSPNDTGYWAEPDLPWTNRTPNTRAELEAFRLLGNGVFIDAHIKDDRMGPRFMAGCSVRVSPITHRRDIKDGVYIWQWEQDGKQYMNMGRLQQVMRGQLQMTQDVDGSDVVCRLRWTNPTFKLFKVVGYNHRPGI